MSETNAGFKQSTPRWQLDESFSSTEGVGRDFTRVPKGDYDAITIDAVSQLLLLKPCSEGSESLSAHSPIARSQTSVPVGAS